MARVLLFDGDCGFCARSARWIVRLGCRVDVTAWQDADLDGFGLTAEQAASRVQLVLDDRSYAGHEAIAHTLRTSRRAWVRLTGRAILLPVVSTVAARVYDVVAAHRHRLPGGTPACALDPREDTRPTG